MFLYSIITAFYTILLTMYFYYTWCFVCLTQIYRFLLQGFLLTVLLEENLSSRASQPVLKSKVRIVSPQRCFHFDLPVHKVACALCIPVISDTEAKQRISVVRDIMNIQQYFDVKLLAPNCLRPRRRTRKESLPCLCFTSWKAPHPPVWLFHTYWVTKCRINTPHVHPEPGLPAASQVVSIWSWNQTDCRSSRGGLFQHR